MAVSWRGRALGRAPEVLDPRLTLQPVAAEPDIVTPTGLAFDAHGRLLVIESHTHQRPQDYAGPPRDRIRLLQDTDGDGKADRFSTFYEGSTSTMSLATHPDGSIYVATRRRVFRLRDTDGNGRADGEESEIVRLETTCDYPHDGLCGLTIDPRGGLYFGMGENLGADYRLIGSDGSELAGGGEGGGIFHCAADGSRLTRIATGFWNPFGICLDPLGRMFAIDNDPDASPPCRLLYVVPGGDYGFEFRYGRTGRHPLQAWNGELPGTLPMMAGTGEAPCAVVPYHGELWVSSWGDNRIERFRLVRQGASFRATREIVIQGDREFRPVGITIAPDGSLYFSDWVDRSYPVHGRGRVWRLAWKTAPPKSAFPPLDDDERRAREVSRQNDPQALRTALGDDDRFVRQAAAWALSHTRNDGRLTWEDLSSPGQKLGFLLARRWRYNTDHGDPRKVLKLAMADADANVRLFAIRWIADRRDDRFATQLDAQLHRPDLSARLMDATLAAIDFVSTGSVAGIAPRHSARLIELASDSSRPERIRTLALHRLSPDDKALRTDLLRAWAAQGPPALNREAVRTLALSTRTDRFAALAEIAADKTYDDNLRADCIVGLSDHATENATLLGRLAKSKSPPIRQAALRALKPAADSTQPASSAPDAKQIDAWLKKIDLRAGNADGGWRVFFGTNSGHCGRCHSFRGRGGELAPDLAGIGNRLSRRRLIESILDPSREIAPRYQAWTIVTVDGKIQTVLSLAKLDGDQREQFVGTDGRTFELKTERIESRHPATTSIMPSGLERLMTLDELRDLVALLSGP